MLKKRTYDEEQMKEIVRIATSERAKLPVDGWSSFTTGLQKNWIFLMFIGSTALWLVTNMLTLRQKNDSQDDVIKILAENQKSIQENAVKYQEKTDLAFQKINENSTSLILNMTKMQESFNYVIKEK